MVQQLATDKKKSSKIYDTIVASYDGRHSSQNDKKYLDRKRLLLLHFVSVKICAACFRLTFQ